MNNWFQICTATMASEEKLYSDQGAYGTPRTRRKALGSCDQQQVPYVFVLQRHLQINWGKAVTTPRGIHFYTTSSSLG